MRTYYVWPVCRLVCTVYSAVKDMIPVIRKASRRFFGSEDGQALVEYALIICVIVIAVLVLSFTLFADALMDLYQNVIAKGAPYFS